MAASIFEGVMVTDLLRAGDRITHVVTEQGNIEVETVVNAAGLWARQVGWMAGVEIPAGVVEHQYLVTEKSDLIPPMACRRCATRTAASMPNRNPAHSLSAAGKGKPKGQSERGFSVAKRTLPV